ncbi:hypothetical protein PTKIN_Ptkin02bG0076500 [Pterospermum kingtungense]
MKILVLSFLCCFFFTPSICSVTSKTQLVTEPQHASTPPRGWNSYDSFCWTISEEDFLQSAEIISNRLKPHGYEYVVVDYLWYRRKVEGAYTDSLGFDVIDEWGRVIPDPERWPSSKGGKGFSEVAKKVHSMGLKFGIHVMRGISLQAFNANTPILDTSKGSAYKESGRLWRAKDIGLKERACAWMPHGFMSINTKLEAGRAFLRSLYLQYAEWGVDFVKHDCVFGDDLDIDEITFVSEVLRKLDRPILYSLSPGTSMTPAMAKDVSGLVNMYRITGDDWDTWKDVVSHFDIARDFSTSKMIGAKGLLGRSWPDLDMLPLGWLTDPGSNEGPHRTCNLNLDEQRTQFPYITGTEGSRSKNKVLSQDLAEGSTLGTLALGLTTCKDPKAHGWSSKSLDQDLEQICWEDKLGSKFEEPPCLYKRKPLLASGEEMIYKHQYQGTLHLLASDSMDLCLDASPRRRLTSKDFGGRSFSPCKGDANQMWELSANGSLTNSYSGLCATVDSSEANKVVSNGIRSWIATGRRGEIYLAFFNLNSEKTVISANIADIAKVLPRKNLNGPSCKYREIWSGRFGVTKQSISIAVETHSSTLFVLNCY